MDRICKVWRIKERETEREKDRESKKEKLNHMMEVEKKKHGWVRIQMKKKE